MEVMLMPGEKHSRKKEEQTSRSPDKAVLGGWKEEQMPRLTRAESAREGDLGNVVKMCTGAAGDGGQEGLTDQGKDFRFTPNEMGSHRGSLSRAAVRSAL